jgi:hypothetical protein
MVPHRCSDEDRRTVLPEEVQIRPDDAAGSIHLMTDDTLLFEEEPLADLQIARGVEVVKREQEGDEVGGLLRGQAGAGNPTLSHLLHHTRQVVPHGGGEIIKRPRTQGAPEVRSNLPTHVVHRVTFDASLGTEDPRASERIRHQTEEPLGKN